MNDRESNAHVNEKKGFKPAKVLVMAMVAVLFGASALMAWYIHRTADPAKMQQPEQAQREMQQ
ncbi:hypothetical protein ASG67_02360 [Sphingomonas sp. Leaf339]|uniref:hypothetical protein n=1 Tax=Sphingomonas sp. Leaf339 TaxID=1736343 RepID=UPI0006F2C844|nr:hypothetical protein [Sphingomonas sp. Leaf339]KQU62007.1 hypothetical protein ASG67_02360 [Sphingomonas sp. Leaf339]